MTPDMILAVDKEALFTCWRGCRNIWRRRFAKSKKDKLEWPLKRYMQNAESLEYRLDLLD